ncbi:MAG: replication-relaxation family protein [Deltaproteobacteria bacterium]|nr:replication-relaxation family protein [Deltaproteobacteria bacterium]
MHQPSLLDDQPTWLPDALRALGRHEFLTARQLALVCVQPAAEVAHALDGLVRERLVHRLIPAAMDPRERAPAFALTRRGADLLASTTDLPRPHVPNAKKSLYLLAHELARNDLGVALHALDRTGALRLLRWETARTKLAASVQLVERGRLTRIPLVADALAVVAATDHKPDALLVEIDRGTVSVARMRQKYRGYVAWWRGGGPERRFGLRSLRVVTLAPTASRLERLREAALHATEGRGSGLLWFGEQRLASLDDPTRLLTPSWTRATPEAASEHLLAPLGVQVAA